MLISRNDVVRIKMPFPNIKSELAVNSHMYICHKVCGTATHFVKCQTLKPYMLFSTPMKHYWDENRILHVIHSKQLPALIVIRSLSRLMSDMMSA